MDVTPLACQAAVMRDRPEIAALTGLRGIAAFAVVLQHTSAAAQDWSWANIPSLAPHGYMAVDLFFVLSGFIMAYTYADAFAQRGLRAFPGFLIRRVARVWPLQVFVVLALVLIFVVARFLTGHGALFETENLARDVAANLFMVQGLGVGTSLNGPSNTVSQELAAYVAFPALLALALHRRRIVAVLALAAAVTVVTREALLTGHLSLVGRDLPDAAFRCFAEFTIGLLTYRLHASGRWAWLRTDESAVTAVGAAACALILGVDLVAALLFPVVVLALARNTGWVGRWTGGGVLHFLGVVSYSLYLLHSPLKSAEFDLLDAIAPGPHGAGVALAVAFIGALTPIPVAWVAHRWVERPGRTLIRAATTGRTSRVIAA